MGTNGTLTAKLNGKSVIDLVNRTGSTTLEPEGEFPDYVNEALRLIIAKARRPENTTASDHHGFLAQYRKRRGREQVLSETSPCGPNSWHAFRSI
jgi:hypothetical protein